MNRQNQNSNFHCYYQSARVCAVAGFAALLCIVGSGCSSTSQTTFSSAEKATDKLVSALRSNDTRTLLEIFGPSAKDVIGSGDPVADKQRRAKFLAAYDERHHLQMDVDGNITVLVGKDSWPLPVPIVHDDRGQWHFDTEAGKDEILNRRIGENELTVIEVCRAIVDAQRDYALRDPDGDGIQEYAQCIASEPGKKNGLYWPTGPGEPVSPLGPLVADAVAEGYASTANTSGQPRPYHGYCYRLLKSQGPSAPGGAMDYIVNGRMIAGFAIVAYPVEYGNSGIMTFMVNQSATVFQKDLGDGTAEIARKMEVFDPGAGWQPVPATPVPQATGGSQ